MNNLHEQLWTSFNDISFEETRHKYTDSLGTNYQSATGWYKQFVPEVDWDEKAKNSARKRAAKKVRDEHPELTGEEKDKLIELETQQLTPQVQAEWKYAGDYSCALGTQIHSVMENLWYKKDYRFDNRLEEKFPGMKEDFEWRKKFRCLPLFKKMKGIYAPVANEFVVYDQPNGICGTIDMIGYNMKTNSYAIIDWKTSKSFDTHSFTGDEYLKAPFDDLEVCNTTEYSLQLSLYKYMLEKHTDMKISELLLFQLPGADKKIPLVHRCMDLSGRIKDFLEKK